MGIARLARCGIPFVAVPLGAFLPWLFSPPSLPPSSAPSRTPSLLIGYRCVARLARARRRRQAGDLVRPFSNLRKWPGRTEELLITFFRLSLARFPLPPSIQAPPKRRRLRPQRQTQPLFPFPCLFCVHKPLQYLLPDMKQSSPRQCSASWSQSVRKIALMMCMMEGRLLHARRPSPTPSKTSHPDSRPILPTFPGVPLSLPPLLFPELPSLCAKLPTAFVARHAKKFVCRNMTSSLRRHLRQPWPLSAPEPTPAHRLGGCVLFKRGKWGMKQKKYLRTA